LRSRLQEAGIETLIHYPLPIPRQPALSAELPADCPVADRVCAEVLSLPLYPAMPEAHAVDVARAIHVAG
jgi:UDP-2-acetamido-2-deoxy-ribo-hexuluronate aminotransferase